MTYSVSNAQRTVLKIAAITAVLLLLFPPFHFVSNAYTIFVSYGFLLAPPSVPRLDHIFATVDVLLLLAEFVALVLVTIALYFALGRRD